MAQLASHQEASGNAEYDEELVDVLREFQDSGADISRAIARGKISERDILAAVDVCIRTQAGAVALGQPEEDEEAQRVMRATASGLLQTGCKVNEPFKVRVTSQEEMRELQRQLFRLGCGFFNGISLSKHFHDGALISGIFVGRRGSMALFMGHLQDPTGAQDFEQKAVRELTLEAVTAARTLDELDVIDANDANDANDAQLLSERPRA